MTEFAKESLTVEDVMALLKHLLGARWDDDIAISEATSLIYDLDLESIEVAVLVQELNVRFPWLGLLAQFEKAGLEGLTDLTIGDLLHTKPSA